MTAPVWRKSSFCNGAAACVEVALLPDGNVGVRDSKLGDASPVLVVPAADWRAFLDAVTTGTLGWAGGIVQLRRVAPDEWCVWLAIDTETELRFDEGEVRAFVNGVHGGEFDLARLAKDGMPSVRGARASLAAS